MPEYRRIQSEIDRKRDKFEKKQTDKVKKFRKEASRQVSLANKRLRRLEESGLTDSPAYQKWAEDGGEYFSIRGKSYNEVQKELARLRQFTNAQTSTIRGVNGVLREMAKNTGIKYKNLTELRKSAGKFFELASKVEQYLRTVEDIASAIGYQKIWQAINEYVESNRIDLMDASSDIDSMVKSVTNALKAKAETEDFRIRRTNLRIDGFFMLDDE